MGGGSTGGGRSSAASSQPQLLLQSTPGGDQYIGACASPVVWRSDPFFLLCPNRAGTVALSLGALTLLRLLCLLRRSTGRTPPAMRRCAAPSSKC